MNTYAIPMKLRRAKANLDYASLASEFGQAQQNFNQNAQKLKNGREITAIDYETGGFIIILNTQKKLSSPSKALRVFSQALSELPAMKRYCDSENRLLCGNGQPALLAQEAPPDFTASPAEILKLVVDILLGENVDNNILRQKERKEAQKEIVEICRQFAALQAAN